MPLPFSFLQGPERGIVPRCPVDRAVKHATSDALDRLEPFLKRLRAVPQLREKTRGVFYRGSRAFLHFHEDGDELWADVRIGAEFERFAATRTADRVALLKMLSASLES